MLLVAWACSAWTGCNRTQQSASPGSGESSTASEHGTAAGQGQETLPDDDPQAIAQLEAAGFALTKNGAGRVIGVSVNRQEDASELLPLLAGLPAIEELRLSGAGITDQGIEVLPKLKRLKRLDLEGSAITDAALAFVGKPPAWRYCRCD
ncbi:MAG: hypothetical protein D6753_11595 [Planctomycetota bacterium]|nr:MAG: hypothetical protein D6753_11595 [Planctomycetota bacterium]